MIIEHDTELELTFAEIPFSEVQSAQPDQALIHVNVAVVCSKTNLVLCIAEIDLDTVSDPRIVLGRRSWIRDEETTAKIRLRLAELFSGLNRHDRYTYL